MQPTQTGIAIALALVVVIFFFVFGGMSLFEGPASSSDIAPITNDQNTSATMPIENVTQLQVTDEVVGTGAVAAAGDTVVVEYTGALTNGTVFDSSVGKAAFAIPGVTCPAESTTGLCLTLGAGQVIQGWDQGIVGMKEGGKRKLIIPSSLAYGDQAIGNVIPANSTLIFEVELVKVQK